MLHEEIPDYWHHPALHFQRSTLHTNDGEELGYDMIRLRSAPVLPKSTPAVICCHGFMQNRYAFSSTQLSLPTHLALNGYTVYCIELRGRNKPNLSHDFSTYTDLDASCYIQHLQGQHSIIHWIGHSMGGLVGLSLPENFRHHLTSITTIASPLLPLAANLHKQQLAQRLIQYARSKQKRGIPISGEFISTKLRNFLTWFDHSRIHVPFHLWVSGTISPPDLRLCVERSFGNDSFGVFADLAELTQNGGTRAGNVNIYERLTNYKGPLLSIVGDSDVLAPQTATIPLFDRVIQSSHKQRLDCHISTMGRHFGHVDLLIGKDVSMHIWPVLDQFLSRFTPLSR